MRLGPTTPLRGRDGWIFHLLDHKTCPIGGEFVFGHLVEAYRIIYIACIFVAHLNQLDQATEVKLESALIYFSNTKINISVMSLRKSVRNYK